MLRHRVTVGWTAAMLPFVAVVGSCSNELPPLPEAVIVVDTDALVPRLVDRLRVDFYESDGTWVDSRDLPRRFSRDWPASFSVYGESDTQSRTVLVRLRAYREGLERDYRGERFLARPAAGDPAEVVQWPPPPAGEEPRLVKDGRDVTPEGEPAPDVTIDRLIQVELVPGARTRHVVVLRGACFGTMVDLEGRTTCVDTENERVEVETAPHEESSGDAAKSLANEFGAPEPCTREPRSATVASDGTPFHDEEVCVPGGAFILGNGDVSGIVSFALPSAPERIAVMTPLLVDRYEVTVARWRRARAEGFDHPYDPESNDDDEPLPSGGPLTYPIFCVYSQSALETHSRESYPVNCLGWDDARAFCRFYGSDLLTEAQWEFAASATGKVGETLYAWGNDEPRCETQVYGRPAAGVFNGFCSSYAYGPAAVGAGTGDVTPLDIHDLGGSMAEWLLDTPHPFDARCWASLGLVDPLCWEEDSEHRSSRGGAWSVGPAEMLSSLRQAPNIVTRLYPHVGFRCARSGLEPSP